MHALVVYCHPYEGSFNHAVKEALCRRYEREGRAYEVIDLYADGFNPVLSREELEAYNRGGVLDPLVERYQRLVADADHLDIVCPIWWNDVPTMLRGWIDKVMLIGFSWEATGSGLVGTLTHVKDVDLYTTSAEPVQNLAAALRTSFIEGTLAQLGIGGLPEGHPGVTAAGEPEVPAEALTRRWHDFGCMDASTAEQREAWLREVEGL